ncbi:hypothetical protein QYE76_018385 [Lolium multiflorum]|uniref:Uncharacterized protein n=1 Tax=Lolium multiflorum TaxID=4521 RepID=A0AAD8QH32_LOLMU|nr:hypothetical protein QYE76_018385 [Lolium multiflorum]
MLASDPEDRKSLSAYCVFLGGSLIAWKTKKQVAVSRSSVEAELRAMALLTAEVTWLRWLLADFGVSADAPTPLLSDSISIARDPVKHELTKHIGVDAFYVRHAVQHQSTMVVHMREGQVVRYKVNAKADMVRNNMTLIRCPCRKCGLRQWIDPDSGQLEEHLLRRGFMLGFNEEPAANVGHEEEADIGREDEESPEHGVHHEEGEADEGDDDAGGDGGGDAERKQRR